MPSCVRSIYIFPTILCMAFCTFGTAIAAPALAFFPGSGISSAEATGEWESPILIIYDAPYCAPEMAMECQLVRLDCYGPELEISVDGFVTRELAEATQSLKLTGLSAMGEPKLNRVEMSFLDSTWSAIFAAPYTQDPGLMLDESLTTLGFETTGKSVMVQLTDEDRRVLTEFIGLCQSE